MVTYLKDKAQSIAQGPLQSDMCRLTYKSHIKLL